MQAVSNAYEESMRQVFRNRGYIRGTIGIINADARNRDEWKEFTYLFFKWEAYF